jgi:hypothetical protein
MAAQWGWCSLPARQAFHTPTNLLPPAPSPAHPADWRGFLAYGFSAKRGSGCNDLVISGHGVVYAAVPLALGTFYPLPAARGGAATAAWLAVLKLCIQVGGLVCGGALWAAPG